MRSAFVILFLILSGAVHAADMETVGAAETERKAAIEAERVAREEAERKAAEAERAAKEEADRKAAEARSTPTIATMTASTEPPPLSPEAIAACGTPGVSDATVAQAIAAKVKVDADAYAAAPSRLTEVGPDSAAALARSYSVDSVVVKRAYFAGICVRLLETGAADQHRPVLVQLAEKLGIAYPVTATVATETQASSTDSAAAQEQAARETAEREAVERAAKEEAERQAAVRAAQEAAEREAKERAEREAAERAAKEETERQAAARAAQEAAEREAKERAEREAEERATKQEAERQAAEQSASKTAAAEPPAAPAEPAPPPPLGAVMPQPTEPPAPQSAPAMAPVAGAPEPAPMAAAPETSASPTGEPAPGETPSPIAGWEPPFDTSTGRPSTRAATPGEDGMLGEAECRALGVLGKCPDLNSVLAKLLEKPLEYNHPKEMLLGKMTEISLVLRTDWEGKDLPTEVSEELKGLPGEVKQGISKITRVMSAELSGRNFEVSPAGRQERTVSPPQQVSWNWQVKPTETGPTQPLKLRLYAHLQGPDGAMPPLLVKTLDATINVDVTTWDWIVNQARTLEPIYAIGAALIGLLTALMTFLLARRRQETYGGGAAAGQGEPSYRADGETTTARPGPVIGDLNQSAADSRMTSAPAPAIPPAADEKQEKPAGTIPVNPEGGIEPKKD